MTKKQESFSGGGNCAINTGVPINVVKQSLETQSASALTIVRYGGIALEPNGRSSGHIRVIRTGSAIRKRHGGITIAHSQRSVDQTTARI